MLIKKEVKQNSSSCIVWEYDYPSKDSSFATALINGCYPDKGKSVNLECEQIYYIISGLGTIYSEKGDFSIVAGDAYYFDKGEAYSISGNNLLVAIINSPKWNPAQYKIVNNYQKNDK